MKGKGLLIALGALVIVLGGVYWSNKHGATNDTAKTAPDESPKILTIPEDSIQELHIARADAPVTKVVKQGSNWQVTEPEHYPADSSVVGAMTAAVASLSGDRLVEEKPADLQPFGLKTPSVDVEVIRKSAAPEHVLIGDESPVGGTVFAKLGSSPKVYTVQSSVKTSLDKTAADLRDKRILTFDGAKISRLEVVEGANTIEVGKNGQNEWQIIKPQPGRADTPAVDELVRKLTDARMQNPAETADPKTLQAFNGASHVATVKATDANGVQTLELRKKGDQYYAKSSAVDGIFTVNAELGDAFAKSIDVRNKRLFDFGYTDVTKLQLGAATYTKTADRWMNGNTQYDSDSIQPVIDRLRDLTASGFGAKPSGSPLLDISVTSGEGQKKTEHVTITQSGSQYYAIREGDSTGYTLDAGTVTALQKDISGIKPKGK